MSKTTWLLIILGALIVLGGSGAAVVINSNYNALINKIAHAIAVAERGAAEIASGNILNNNPGDIEDGAGHLVVYPTLDDGWNALLHQVALFFGGSAHYNPTMSINQVAQIYVGTSDWPNWANNVAAILGVSPDTALNQLQA